MAMKHSDFLRCLSYAFLTLGRREAYPDDLEGEDSQSYQQTLLHLGTLVVHQSNLVLHI